MTRVWSTYLLDDDGVESDQNLLEPPAWWWWCKRWPGFAQPTCLMMMVQKMTRACSTYLLEAEDDQSLFNLPAWWWWCRSGPAGWWTGKARTHTAPWMTSHPSAAPSGPATCSASEHIKVIVSISKTTGEVKSGMLSLEQGKSMSNVSEKNWLKKKTVLWLHVAIYPQYVFHINSNSCSICSVGITRRLCGWTSLPVQKIKEIFQRHSFVDFSLKKQK